MKALHQRINREICKVVGHKYFITRQVTVDIRELECERCGGEFGMNDKVEAIVPMDKTLKKLHDRLVEINDEIIERQIEMYNSTHNF